jgi:fimbrial chaperone protein
MSPRQYSLCAAFAILASAATADAGRFQVNPTRIELRGTRPAQLALGNRTRARARFHVKAYLWRQSASGEMKLSPTTDIVVYPSLFELPPGSERAIRIAAAVRPGRRERSYRLMVEELPSLHGPASDQLSIAIRTRMSIPVFMAPDRQRAAGAVAGSLAAGTLELAVENRGNVHFRLASLEVKGFDRGGATLFVRSAPGWYVLSGDRRRYSLELDPRECRQAARLVVKAASNRGDWRDEIIVGPSDCGM